MRGLPCQIRQGSPLRWGTLRAAACAAACPRPCVRLLGDGGFASGDGGVGRVYTRAGIPVFRPEGAQTVSFQQKMYVVFLVAMAMLATACVLAFRNGGKVEGTSYWLIVAAVFPFIAGLPAFINQHLHIWDDKDDNEK